MRRALLERPNSQKVTDAVLFVIDAIKRQRKPGFKSDTDFAKALNIPSTTVSYWRKKERSITVDQICDFCRIFEVNANFIIKQEGTPWGESELAMRIKTLEERQLEMDLRLTHLENPVGKKSGKKQG